MEPFPIRTVPARLPAFTIVAAAVLSAVLVYILWLGAQTTVLIVRRTPDDASRLVTGVVLLVVAYLLTWIYLRMYAPVLQVVCWYLFRDRGKRVVIYRLDESGWRHVVAGSDVVIPWPGMTAEVTERADDHFHVRVTSSGPFVAARDPFSRQVRRTLRKERGLMIALTSTNPTEDELASAIAQQSAGRVVLTR